VSGATPNIKNAFYSQAVADAMGEVFEFSTPKAAQVRKLMSSDAPLYITDDTQMALFGQEAIERSQCYFELQDYSIEFAYRRWYRTQTEDLSQWCGLSGLEADPLMNHRRAPGSQCMSALGQMSRGETASTAQGMGCGAVMRLLPFAGLYTMYNPKAVQSIAIHSAKVTHSHPVALQAVTKYMHTAYALLQMQDRETLGYSGKKITDYGGGWTALECVEMACWAVQHAKDYDDLLLKAICHSGDSDSVAAVAGSLWGLAGLGGWEKYQHRLVEAPVIEKLFATQ
jgi:ADP-ribosylglycohydrolase